jgi:hypothetical protein
MDKTEQTEYITKTIQVGCATVCIHQPILSEKEREKRTKNLVSALERYGKAIYKN